MIFFYENNNVQRRNNKKINNCLLQVQNFLYLLFAFIELVQSFILQIINNLATSNKSSRIDHILFNNDDVCHKIFNIDWSYDRKQIRDIKKKTVSEII